MKTLDRDLQSAVRQKSSMLFILKVFTGFTFSFILILPSGSGLLSDFGQNSSIVAQETQFDCLPSPPPPPPPAQHSGAEGLPPLPLPVVPLRRTEKKNPPRPPVLISRLVPQEQKSWADSFGNTDNLLRWMASNMDVHFSSINLPEAEIPNDPSEIPIIYRTGLEAFSLNQDARNRLRTYLEEGGTLILEARCGRWNFFESALREMTAMFPDRPPYRLNYDHPLYRAYFEIKPEDIRYRQHAQNAGARNGRPSAIGIDIGCRTAIFLFRWDVSSGWDGLNEERAPHCLGYSVESSRMLGANLMAYITAERQAAMPLSRALQFIDAESRRAGKFMVAQIRYPGLWKTHEAGLSMLLHTFHEQTQAPVAFEKRQVDLESSRLFDYPLVYITGHHDFEISPRGRENLRRHLQRGGVLFAENCCGRLGFDHGIRRLLKQAIPEASLVRLPVNHPVFLFPNQISEVRPRPALARRLRTEKPIDPVLYGLYIDNRLAAIYSPHDLSSGWELTESPYCAGLISQDAMAMGVNILAYSLMQ